MYKLGENIISFNKIYNFLNDWINMNKAKLQARIWGGGGVIREGAIIKNNMVISQYWEGVWIIRVTVKIVSE